MGEITTISTDWCAVLRNVWVNTDLCAVLRNVWVELERRLSDNKHTGTQTLRTSSVRLARLLPSCTHWPSSSITDLEHNAMPRTQVSEYIYQN